MEEYNMRGSRMQIPAFGNWEYGDEMPITQYFESAMQAGLIRGHFFADDPDDLFKVPTAPIKHYHHHYSHRKAKRVEEKKKQQQSVKEQTRKQGRVYDRNNTKQSSPTRVGRSSGSDGELAKPPKAVDEDLYKIPPELLCQKPRRKRMLRSLWSGCLGLNCVA